MKKSSSGRVRRSFHWRSTRVAPAAIRAGGMSPIGEPLAMLPPIVPLLRTWVEPSRRIIAPRSG
jgi:hypothetical protein